MIFPTYRCDLNVYKKSETNTILQKTSFYNIVSEYAGALKIYTDGSKTDLGVGSAFSSFGISYSWKLPPTATIFTAELYAIWQALRYAEAENNRTILLISDSLSSLQALKDVYNENPLVQRIQALVSWLGRAGKLVYFIWCPSHIGITGNELADSEARRAADGDEVDNIPVTNMDIRQTCKQEIRQAWHLEWNGADTKLNKIKSGVEKWPSPLNLTRREQVTLTRLRIGHTHLTSFHLLRGEAQPTCLECNRNLTIDHILLDCPLYENIRESVKLPNTLKDCLGNESTQIKTVLEYVKRSNLYKKI